MYYFINKLFPYSKSDRNVNYVLLNVDYISLFLKQKNPQTMTIIAAKAGEHACNGEMNTC